MKALLPKSLWLLALLALAQQLHAQVPEQFNYQLALRDAQGELYASQQLSLRISILEGSTILFQETHQTTTTVHGLVNLVIGTGTPTLGSMAAIDWGGAQKTLQVEFDPQGGSNYQLLSASSLLSVPYALHAKTTDEPGPMGPESPQGPQGVQGPQGPEGPMPPIGGENTQVQYNHEGALAGSPNFVFNPSNNYVGIGTSNPNTQLSILGNNLADITFYTPASGLTVNDGLRIGTINSSFHAWLWNYENGDLYFGTNNEERMRITKEGNIGMGTSSPDATLDVQGTMAVGLHGVVFSEIREITGTTIDSDHVIVSFPSGYNQNNTRVLSLEINYSGNAWIGIGGTNQNSSNISKVFYYLGSSIWIYYPPISNFQNRAFRMLLMKVQ